MPDTGGDKRKLVRPTFVLSRTEVETILKSLESLISKNQNPSVSQFCVVHILLNVICSLSARCETNQMMIFEIGARDNVTVCFEYKN